MFETESVHVGLVGAGRLAASLGDALVEAGYAVEGVASQRVESAARLASGLGPRVAALPVQALVDRCNLVFLTVPDSAVAQVASQVAWRPGQGVVHCSGALTLEVLAPAAARGAQCGCFHPLQSFPSRDGNAARFRDITCGIEAGGALNDALETLATRLGARVVRLEGVDRAAYHAAAVFASNYVVSLMVAARETWALAGLPVDSARTALAPLLSGAADNIVRHELGDALTGPVVRGDVETIRRHLAALGNHPLAELYRGLATELLALDLHHNPETAAALRAVLDGPSSRA